MNTLQERSAQLHQAGSPEVLLVREVFLTEYRTRRVLAHSLLEVQAQRFEPPEQLFQKFCLRLSTMSSQPSTQAETSSETDEEALEDEDDEAFLWRMRRMPRDMKGRLSALDKEFVQMFTGHRRFYPITPLRELTRELHAMPGWEAEEVAAKIDARYKHAMDVIAVGLHTVIPRLLRIAEEYPDIQDARQLAFEQRDYAEMFGEYEIARAVLDEIKDSARRRQREIPQPPPPPPPNKNTRRNPIIIED